MDIITKADTSERLTERAIYPKGSGSVEVKSYQDTKTGKMRVETQHVPVAWDNTSPGFAWRSSESRMADDTLWHEKLEIAKEQIPLQPTEELPDINQLLHDAYDDGLPSGKGKGSMAAMAERGVKSFSGLGGLLGPKGKLTGKADAE